jgi:geranylgeranyl pyrophosphate synthase
LASPTDQGCTLTGALAVTSAKSGTLVATICRLGAMISGVDEQRQQLFAQFGRHLGTVAQLANDIAALDPTAVGKTDVAFCRPTLPLAYAALSRPLTPTDMGDSLNLWTEGPVQFTWAVAETYRRLALDLIPCMTEDAAAQAALATLLHLL